MWHGQVYDNVTGAEQPEGDVDLAVTDHGTTGTLDDMDRVVLQLQGENKWILKAFAILPLILEPH